MAELGHLLDVLAAVATLEAGRAAVAGVLGVAAEPTGEAQLQHPGLCTLELSPKTPRPECAWTLRLHRCILCVVADLLGIDDQRAAAAEADWLRGGLESAAR